MPSKNDPDDDWLSDLPASVPATSSAFLTRATPVVPVEKAGPAPNTKRRAQVKPVYLVAAVAAGSFVLLLGLLGWWLMSSGRDQNVAGATITDATIPGETVTGETVTGETRSKLAAIAGSPLISNRVAGYPWDPTGSEHASIDESSTAVTKAAEPSVTSNAISSSPHPTAIATAPIVSRLVILKQTIGGESGNIFTGLIVGKVQNNWIIATTSRIAELPTNMKPTESVGGRADARPRIGVKWICDDAYIDPRRGFPSLILDWYTMARSHVDAVTLLTFASPGTNPDLESLLQLDPDANFDSIDQVRVIGFDAVAAEPASLINPRQPRNPAIGPPPEATMVSMTVDQASQPNAAPDHRWLSSAPPAGFGGGVVVDDQDRPIGLVAGATSDRDGRRITSLAAIMDLAKGSAPSPVALPLQRTRNGGQYVIHLSNGLPFRRLREPKIVFETIAESKAVEIGRVDAKEIGNEMMAFVIVRHAPQSMLSIYVQWTDDGTTTRRSKSIPLEQALVRWLPDWNQSDQEQIASTVDPESSGAIMLPMTLNEFAVDSSSGNVFGFRVDEAIVYRFDALSIEPKQKYEVAENVHAIDWNADRPGVLDVELLSGSMQTINIEKGVVGSSQLAAFGLSLPSDPSRRRDSNRIGRPLVDPRGEFRIDGQSVERMDGGSVATLPAEAIAMLDSSPLIVTAKPDSPSRPMPRLLQLVSTNDWQPIGESVNLMMPTIAQHHPLQSIGIRTAATWPEVPIGPQRQHRPPGRSFAIDVDEKRKEIVFAHDQFIERIPMQRFGVEVIADLRLLTSMVNLTIGQSSRVEVLDTASTAQLEYANLPIGIQVDGHSLQWTPRSTESGPHRIAVTLRQGDVVRETELTLNVRFPEVATPTTIDDFALIPSGDKAAQYAVGWTMPSPHLLRNTVKKIRSSLCLFSLTDPSKSKNMALNDRIHAVGISGGSAIVVLENEPMQARIIDLKTMQSTRTLLADRPIDRIETVGPHLHLRSQESQSVYDAQSFRKLVDSPFSLRYDAPPSILVEGGLVREGVYWITGSRTPDLVLHPMGMVLPFPTDYTLNGTGGLASPPTPFQPLSVSTLRQVLGTAEDSPPVQAVASSVAIADPAVVASLVSSITSPMVGPEQRSIVQTRLFFNGGDGKTLANVLFDSFTTTRDQPAAPPIMRTDGQLLYILQRAKMSIVDPRSILTDWSGFTAFGIHTFRFQSPRDRIMLPAKDTISLEHQVAGAEGTVQYFLPQTIKGITIDQNSGTVSIDGPKLRESILRQIVQSQSVVIQYPPGRTAVQPSQRFKNLVDDFKPAMTQWALRLQRRLDGLPVAIPIHVRATDAGGHVADLQYYLIEEVSPKQVLQQLAAAP